MKNRTHILTLFVLLLFLPVSEVLACGNSKENSKIVSNSCSANDHHTEKKSCCDSEKNHADEGMGGSCSNTSCHCPVPINAPVYLTNFELTSTNNYIVLEIDWAYIQKNPKLVYLPIWQWPKIG
ncbi:hypothetical protein H4O18_07290 [Arenibacter sp. BSSL-BM3]|uniref:Uncharacterized protein n=1 Tax=Arenibacter arenosicollis TaxID=2762274 RepID=A0ABR7QL01_9FLAO|nr:hypothetical protein [Arenibacter arenosicollis]MBC8767789.1 hypothetical protein [Arenibacter arenosicollis]